MSKINPLASCRNVLQWIRVLPIEKDASISKRIISITIAMALIISMGTMAPSATFFWKYISTDLEGCLYALFQISALIGTINAIITVLFFHREIGAMFTSLLRIYDERKTF